MILNIYIYIWWVFPEYRKKDKENKSEDVIDYKGTYYNFRNITGSESITL